MESREKIFFKESSCETFSYILYFALSSLAPTCSQEPTKGFLKTCSPNLFSPSCSPTQCFPKRMIRHDKVRDLNLQVKLESSLLVHQLLQLQSGIGTRVLEGVIVISWICACKCRTPTTGGKFVIMFDLYQSCMHLKSLTQLKKLWDGIKMNQ